MPGFIIRGIQANAQSPFTIGIVILAAGIHVKGSAGKIKLIIKATERIRNPKISKMDIALPADILPGGHTPGGRLGKSVALPAGRVH